MKRLRDRTDPVSPIEAGAISLLRTVEQYQPPSGLKQRVRSRLLASHSVTHARLFRPVVAATLVLVAAGASAAIGGTWVVRQYLTHKPTPVELTKQDQIVVSPVAKVHDVVQPPQSPLMPEPSPVVDPPPPVVGVGAASRPVMPSEPVKLVFDSMRALRRDGQPERASKLLDEYLRRYPNGALAEEALALSIEAASLRGDPRAKELARRYLARYPTGQFQKAAERARARFSP